jgi:TolA-binding protein
MEAEVREAESQLKYLQEQLADLDQQRQEHEKAIKEAKRIVDVKKHSTKSEILTLKGWSFHTRGMQRGLMSRGANSPARDARGSPHVAIDAGRVQPLRVHIS